jgi:hypothetical protein
VRCNLRSQRARATSKARSPADDPPTWVRVRAAAEAIALLLCRFVHPRRHEVDHRLRLRRVGHALR